MGKITIHHYLESNCELKKPSPVVLIEIFRVTNGRPCDDCGCRHNCQDRHNIEGAAKELKYVGPARTVETNQQIADKTGLSKRQISKMRKAGKFAQ